MTDRTSPAAKALPAGNLGHWIGLAGVAVNENARARRVGHWFEWLLVPLALWLPIQLSLESSGQVSSAVAQQVAWITWLIFVAEAAALGRLVDHRRRYFRGNWLNLLIIVFGLPALWGDTDLLGAGRAARLLVMLSLLANAARMVRHMLS